LIKKQQYNHNCRRRVYITLLIHYTHHEPPNLTASEGTRDRAGLKPIGPITSNWTYA